MHQICNLVRTVTNLIQLTNVYSFDIMAMSTFHRLLTLIILADLFALPHSIFYTFIAKATGHKAFRFADPTVWNSIPQNIRLLACTGSFKRSLKTHHVPNLVTPAPLTQTCLNLFAL